MLLTTTSERQGRAIDHDQAARWRRRSRKDIFDDRIPRRRYQAHALIAPDIDAYLAQHQHKIAAALHHLRQRSTTASRR